MLVLCIKRKGGSVPRYALQARARSMSKYDRAITVFSPDGHLFQVEYAMEAVRKGTTAIGIEADGAVVLAVEKKSTEKLQEARTVRKICPLDKHICVAFAGLTADGRVLVNKARMQCQSYKLNYEDDMPVDGVASYIARTQQKYTQSGGVRPFGVSTLVAGEGRLYQTDPSGIVTRWHATSIGRSAKTVLEYLEKQYSLEKQISVEEAEKLAVQALLEVVDGGAKSIEIAVQTAETGLVWRAEDVVEKLVEEIEAEQKEQKEQKQKPKSSSS